MVKRKIYRICAVIRTPGRSQESMMVCFVAESIDWLWQRLQYLGAQGKSLLALRSPQLNPFHQVMVRLTELLTVPFDSTALHCLFYHFSWSSTQEDLRGLSAMAHKSLVSSLARLPFPKHNSRGPAQPKRSLAGFSGDPRVVFTT